MRPVRQVSLARRVLVRVVGRAGLLALTALLVGGAIGGTWPRKNKGLPDELWTLSKVHARACADVLVLGDSRAGSGLIPSELRAYFPGKDVYNWSFASNGYTSAYLDDATRVLRSSGDRIILAGISPYAFTPKHQVGGYLDAPKPWLYEFKWQHLSGLMEFIRPIPKWDLMDRLRGKGERGWYRTYKPDGSFEGYMVPPRPEYAPERARHEYRNQRVDQTVLDGFFAHVARWRAEGIEVYVVRPPASPEMEALEAESGFDQAEFVRQLERAGGRWIDIPRGARWESYDGSHILPEKARELSRMVGQFIVSVREGSPPGVATGTISNTPRP